MKEETKKRIESLTTDEMAHEVNMGSKSRFQREAFAYLKTHELRLKAEMKTGNKTSDPPNKKWAAVKYAFEKLLLPVIVPVLSAIALYLLYKHLGISKTP